MELLEVYYTSLDIGGVDAEDLTGTYDQVCRQKSQIQRWMNMTLQDGDALHDLIIFWGGCGGLDGYNQTVLFCYAMH